jgi:DNA anti-recombination protein RmuC
MSRIQHINKIAWLVLNLKHVREELFENEEQYVTSLRNNIQKIHEIARKTLKTAQETMKRDYDSNMREV